MFLVRWTRLALRQDLKLCTLVLGATLSLFFGFLKLVNLLGIKYLYFYSPKIVSIVIFSPIVDLWVWVVSLFVLAVGALLLMAFRGSLFRWLALLCLLALSSFALLLVNGEAAIFVGVPLGFALVGLSGYFLHDDVKGRKRFFYFVLSGLAVLVFFFAFSSFLTWGGNAFDYSYPFDSSGSWRFALVDVGLFYVFYPLTSWLLVMLLYSWFWIPVGKVLVTRVSRLKAALLKLRGNVNLDSGKLNRKYLVLGLLLIIGAAVFVAYYPYVHLSGSVLAGSDAYDYYGWLRDMMANGTSNVWQRDRPAVDLLLFGVQRLSGLSAENVVRIMPILCAVCACLAVFWFVRTSLKNDVLALGAAFLSVTSFQLTVSINAYSLANWLALIMAFVLFGLLLKGFEERSLKFLLACSVAGMVLLLVHPYTWYIVMAILVAYGAASLVWMLLKNKPEEKLDVLRLILVLAINFVFYMVYSLSPFGKGVSSVSESVVTWVSPAFGFLNVHSGLANMVDWWVGGLFGNALLVGLAIFGAVLLSDFAKRFNRLMMLWVAVPSVLLFVVSAESFFYYRLVYLVPFQILAFAGLYWIAARLEAWLSTRTGRDAQVLRIVLIAGGSLFLLNYALRSVDGSLLHIVG